MYNSFITLFLGLFLTLAHAQSLLDALRSANALAYATYLESNPQSLAFLNSSNVQTIFAPTDEAFQASSLGNATTISRLRSRQSGGIDSRVLFMSAARQQSAAQARFGQGEPIFTNFQNSSGGSQAAVSGPPSTPAVNSSKLRRRQAGNSSTVSLFTGLGNSVDIVQEDTPYTGGLIQTINGFVLPRNICHSLAPSVDTLQPLHDSSVLCLHIQSDQPHQLLKRLANRQSQFDSGCSGGDDGVFYHQ